MKIFNPYQQCAGCGKAEMAIGIESTSGYYIQCNECKKDYDKTGFIKIDYLLNYLQQRIMICEAQMNEN